VAVLKDLMMTRDLNRVALTLVADGKGILAADETVLTFSTSCIYMPTITVRPVPAGTEEMENTQVNVASPPHRREWHDD
jgi:fructose-bisphosphate aldolase class 1